MILYNPKTKKIESLLCNSSKLFIFLKNCLRNLLSIFKHLENMERYYREEYKEEG